MCCTCEEKSLILSKEVTLGKSLVKKNRIKMTMGGLLTIYGSGIEFSLVLSELKIVPTSHHHFLRKILHVSVPISDFWI